MRSLIVTLLNFVLGLGQVAWAEENPTIDFKKPVLYTTSFMAIGYAGLTLSGEIEGPNVNKFKNAYRKWPRFDDDSGFFNFVLHPLWGSETYLRAREANFGMIGSIGFSMTASVAWEYLIESWSQHPSSHDLIFTTGIGWMIGEVRYKLKHNMDDKYDWLLDPINTTLEHLKPIIIKGTNGQEQVLVSASWNF